MPTPAFCVYGVFSRRDDSGGVSQYCRHHRHRCHPQGRAADFTYIRYDGDSGRGYPNLTVITVTTVTRLPCEGNLPAPFLPVVAVTDIVFTEETGTVFVEPLRHNIGRRSRFPHRFQ